MVTGEVGCLGAWPLADFMAAHLPAPAAIVVGEPTRMGVVGAHKGIVTLRTSVRGHSVHSSQIHRGVSAVGIAARLVGWLDERMALLGAETRSDHFDPPFTTIQCGTIAGGTAVNVVASDCAFTTDIRTVDGVDPRDLEDLYRRYVEAEVVPGMRAVHSGCGVEIEQLSFTPSLDPRPGGAAESLCLRLSGANAATAVSYSTEAGVFQAKGFDAALCGPGSIDPAHQADEYIDAEQLDRAAAFLSRLVDGLAD